MPTYILRLVTLATAPSPRVIFPKCRAVDMPVYAHINSSGQMLTVAVVQVLSTLLFDRLCCRTTTACSEQRTRFEA